MLHRAKAFTLVELIVVITIVSILSTVGFVSYTGYLTGARDSNRMSQMIKISDSLQVYAATKSLPLPDDYIEITASGASNVIAYQGYVGVDVLETLDYTNGGQDPKDDSYYTYYLTRDRKSMQILTFMEEAQSLGVKGFNFANMPQTQAADYSDRFPKVYGRKLGVLTQIDTNTPAQEVTAITSGSGYLDVVYTTDNFVANISDETNDKIEGAGTVLRAIIPNGSCRRIKETGGANGNGKYTINPAGAGEFRVYCDMETSGGGWTMVARGVTGGTGTFNLTGSVGSIDDDTAPYTISVANIPHTQEMLASYTSGKNIDDSVLESDTTADLTVSTQVLGVATISGGGSLNGETGMIFIK